MELIEKQRRGRSRKAALFRPDLREIEESEVAGSRHRVDRGWSTHRGSVGFSTKKRATRALQRESQFPSAKTHGTYACAINLYFSPAAEPDTGVACNQMGITQPRYSRVRIERDTKPGSWLRVTLATHSEGSGADASVLRRRHDW